ncbi:hypothetical protein BDZ89DRAFT_1058680 [Hymenopellis radicata]|nr:hypothetical protein BDZ89DRAFT_1058680 [Hymenopellis radicata]
MPVSPKKLAKRDKTPLIKRTDAAKLYKLKPADLDTLLPAKILDNFYGGQTKKYNTGDVERLAAQLKNDPSSSAALSRPACTTKKKGGTIMKTQAMQDYQLTAADMGSIKPRQVKENPHGDTEFMYVYNLVDVKELAKTVHGGAAASSSQSQKTSPRKSPGNSKRSPRKAIQILCRGFI